MTQVQLPPAYQGDIDRALQQRMLAQLLMQQSMQQRPQGQMVSGHYVRTNPLQHLANVFSGLQGKQMDVQAGMDIASAQERFAKDQERELAQIQALMHGMPDRMTQNFVMQPDESGMPKPAVASAVQADPIAAEQMAQRSRFPAAQALGKTLFEQRIKRLAEMQKEIASRVPVEDVPKVYEGQVSGLRPKAGFQYVDGIPQIVPSEATAGGPAPQPVGPGWQQGTMPGPSGPMAVQENPYTGKVDAIDKTPKVSVSTGAAPEDPYWKRFAEQAADRDVAVWKKAQDAPGVIAMLERIRKLHLDSKGEWTGGPAAGPVRFIRDLASQFGVPIDERIDLTNARMQAEFNALVVKEILGQGRGITDEDAKRLQRSFPSDAITPRQMTAFLDQYEKMVRDNAAQARKLVEKAQSLKGREMPMVLRPLEELPAPRVDDATKARLNEIRRAAGLPPL